MDFFPLILLFAISVTGLALTVSQDWLRGEFYSFLAILHAITVIAALLFLPFGKFFHIFQRPAQLGVKLYQAAGAAGEPAQCAPLRRTLRFANAHRRSEASSAAAGLRLSDGRERRHVAGFLPGLQAKVAFASPIAPEGGIHVAKRLWHRISLLEQFGPHPSVHTTGWLAG